MDVLKEGLLSLAEKAAAGPGGRERIAALLREVLASVEPSSLQHCPCCTPEIAAAIGDLSACLILAADHAEYLALKVSVLMTPILQAVS